MLWNKTITLYNRYECEYEDTVTKEKSKKIEWIHREIDDCFAKRVLKETVNGSTKSSSYEYIVRIPEQQDYISPKEWEETPNELKQYYLTLQPGDLIVIGRPFYDFENLPIDEYVPGQRSNDIILKTADIGSFFIKETHINTDFPFRPHYFVKG